MDNGWFILAGLVSWFALAVAFGNSYKGSYESTGTSGGPDEQLGSIFPVGWIPPFMRNDWMVEEILQDRQLYRGGCQVDLAGYFEYFDKRLKKTIIVEFKNGIVTALVA